MIKAEILQKIYEVFAEWSHSLPTVCKEGCSTCCTQNVNIIALEGEAILRFVITENLAHWLSEKLAQQSTHQSAEMTTNDFAEACLEGREIKPVEIHDTPPCPFLEENSCRIYPVRPFGCRLFASTAKCSFSQPAVIPNYYFEAATAVTQLIEHLGQREYWGNMLDVLPALLDINEFQKIGSRLEKALIVKARLRTITAKPLPGFLLTEEDGSKVTALLHKIFSSKVSGKRLEDVLNGQ